MCTDVWSWQRCKLMRIGAQVACDQRGACRFMRRTARGCLPRQTLVRSPTLPPPKHSTACRRVRFNKHLPTAEALGAYFATYGRHCRTLHLGHLDAASEQVGRLGGCLWVCEAGWRGASRDTRLAWMARQLVGWPQRPCCLTTSPALGTRRRAALGRRAWLACCSGWRPACSSWWSTSAVCRWAVEGQPGGWWHSGWVAAHAK